MSVFYTLPFSIFMIILISMRLCEQVYKSVYHEIFIEGGNSCTNSFIVGALIGAKQGVNEVFLSAPVCVNRI